MGERKTGCTFRRPRASFEQMKPMCALLAWAAALHAAMLSGIVEESGSSKPLSGAQVVVSQIGTTSGGVHSVRTGRNGGFEILSLPAGVYVI